MTTIRKFSADLGQDQILARALSYHPTIAQALLATPCDWSSKLHASAGYASSRRGISLHHGLRAEGPQAIIDTFLHEVAHIMQYLVYREFNHGATWWEMMHHLGAKPVRTHSYKSAAFKRGPKEELSPNDFL
jgi:hypothetical protein